MADPSGVPSGVVLDAAPSGPPPGVVLDPGPSNPPPNVTLDATPQPPSLLHRIATSAMESNPAGAETVGFGKQTANALAGIMNIVNQHASGAIPKAAQPDMQKAAQWLKEQGELRGWSEPGGAGEHMGAMGADYLGWEGLANLIAGAGTAVAGSGIVKNIRNMANLGDVLDKYPVLKQAAGIGLRTVSHVVPALQTAAQGYGQSYVMSGGDTEQAKESAILSGLLHVTAAPLVGPLGDYINGLKSEAAEAAKPQPPPRFQEAEPQPEAPAPPVPRAPAAERFAGTEQEIAQQVAQEHLEDLNRYRTVDERGTPTNIQQLGLPSQSATQPYQFTVPGWSATSEAGDLLHEAAAKYKQVATRVVEGKGVPDMQPWNMQQVPFDQPLYQTGVPAEERIGPQEETPRGIFAEPPTIPPAVPAEPPTSQFSHREPIMQATQFKTAVRPGSDIRQPTTIGGPSILTTDPDVASGHLDQIERIVQGPNFNALPPQVQADILISRNDVMRQMQEYQNLQPQHEYSPYLHQPTFQPVDVDAALSRVGDMGDAAQEMMRGPSEMYQRWEDLTQNRPGGSFKDLNDELSDLGGKSGVANRQRLAQVQQEMQRMFNGSDPYLGRAGTNVDRAIASSQFSDGYLVRRADDAFTNAYSGADRTGDFSVSKLQSNWKSLVNDVGAPRMRNVLGPERYEAMNNTINDMAGEPAGDKAAAAAAAQQHQGAMADWKQRDQLRQQVNQANLAQWRQNDAISSAAKQKWYYDLARNGWHHMATGAGLEGVANLMPRGAAQVLSHKLGAALILKQIVTHPAIAQLAYQGAQLGTKPAIYGPIISDLIRRYHTPPAPPPGGP